MPLSSKRFFRNKIDTGGGERFQLNINLVESFSGNSNVKYPGNTVIEGIDDATTLNYVVDTNAPNATLRYEIEDLGNNLVAGDFTDSILAANVTADANGNINISKTISTTTGTGHKSFRLKIVRPTDTTLDLALGSNINLYEVIPFDITGGDTTYTSNVTANNYTNDGIVYGAMKSHTYTTTGNANLTISNYGNYTGNANVWKTVFATDNRQSYNQIKTGETYNTDIHIKTMAIAGGGAGILGGGGAGDVVNAIYPPENVTPNTYTLTIGTARSGALPSAGGSNVFPLGGNPITWVLDDKNYSELFAGNSNLSLTAWSGGNGGSSASSGAGFYGASGGGGNGQGSGEISRFGAIDIVTYSAPDGPQPGFSDMIDWTVWNQGSPNNLTIKTSSAGFDFTVLNGTSSMGSAGGEFIPQVAVGESLAGGGATGRPTGTNNKNGGAGAILYLNQDTNSWRYDIEDPETSDPTWYNQPLFEFGNSNITVSAGGCGAGGNTAVGTGNYGSGGNGGNSSVDVGGNGAIVISYPHRQTRFITTEDLS
jgi:hypothetical protein